MPVKARKIGAAGLGVLFLAGLFYLSPSIWLGILLCRTHAGLARAQWPGATTAVGGRVVQVDKEGTAREMAAWQVVDQPGGVRGVYGHGQGQRIRLVFGEPFRLEVGENVAFLVKKPVFQDAQQAWRALFVKPVMPPALYRWAAAFILRPRWDGWESFGARRYVRVRIQGGHIWGTLRGRLAGGAWEGRIRGRDFRIELSPEEYTEEFEREWLTSSSPRKDIKVFAPEMDRSIAAAIRLLALQTQPIPVEPDGEVAEGEGRLVVRDGARILQITGPPHEMGRQQGVLLADSVRRGVDRVVYGVGLLYSVSRGEWFFDTARDVIRRQRPFVDDRFFEEMRGIAEGAGVTLEEIEIANFFPELWHCSGAALFGSATVGGKMLHARVLDYIMIAGLQDEAVLIAARPEGRAGFVNIGYSGFVGSVTGMNEFGVAIGEMGGSGYGQWDGTPMSLLVRGALEECGTLDETLAYFRDRPRTCEYYYVFSDGRGRTAAAVRATPDQMDVVFPGEAHPALPDPVPDTVLLSGGGRYRHLVQRVREQHGRIDVERLIQILKRPVSMNENLHNVIFEVEDRVVHIAHAGRRTPACDRPYLRVTWEELFPEPR